MGGDPTLGSGESGNGFAGLAELLIPITTTLEVERAQIQEYLLRNIPGPGNNWKSEVDPNDPEVHQRFERGVWLSNVLTYLKKLTYQLATARATQTEPSVRVDLRYIPMSAIATRALDTAENLTGILRDHQEDFTTPRIGDVVGPDIAEQGMRAARGRQSDGRLWFLDVLSRPDAHITTLLRNPASYSQYFTQRGAEADTGIVAFPTRVDGVTVEVYIEAGSVIAQTLVIQ